VVKLGSNLFFDDGGNVARDRILAFIDDIAAARLAGRQVIVVSSGAVALGANALKIRSGNASLEEDFSGRQRYLNLRHTLTTLLDMGVIPIINENDTVSTTELETTDRSPSFGDNDKLSALVMSKLDANILILLSDVDGLFTENPRENPKAELIPEVHDVTPDVEALAGRKSSRGRGGMSTKLQAANGRNSQWAESRDPCQGFKWRRGRHAIRGEGGIAFRQAPMDCLRIVGDRPHPH
jgi:glutamate 5-kinase